MKTPSRTTPAIAIASLLLFGCADSNDEDARAPGEGGAAPPAADAGGGFEEAHAIEPEDVEAYVAESEARRVEIFLELDGERFEIAFLDFDQENDTLFTSFPGGVLGIGFDFDTESPLPLLLVLESDVDVNTVGSQEEFLASITRTLIGDDLDLREDASGNLVFSGRLRDEASGEELDVRLVVNETLVDYGNSALEVVGEQAALSGHLGTMTYVQLRDLLATNPEVTRLNLTTIAGSLNDAINFHTGVLIRDGGLDTHLPSDGDVNSGGVDLFIAGNRRTAEEGGILGVHSWCCERGLTGAELPRDDPAHAVQLTYARRMLGAENGPAFYYYTLEAAPFEEIHPMTREEMRRFGVVTE